VPADAFAACAADAESLTGIGIAVTLTRHRGSLGTLIRTIKKAGVTAPDRGGRRGDHRRAGANAWRGSLGL
jgi:hypothetical protein